jgi:hypothetical protein
MTEPGERIEPASLARGVVAGLLADISTGGHARHGAWLEAAERIVARDTNIGHVSDHDVLLEVAFVACEAIIRLAEARGETVDATWEWMLATNWHF